MRIKNLLYLSVIFLIAALIINNLKLEKERKTYLLTIDSLTGVKINLEKKNLSLTKKLSSGNQDQNVNTQKIRY